MTFSRQFGSCGEDCAEGPELGGRRLRKLKPPTLHSWQDAAIVEKPPQWRGLGQREPGWEKPESLMKTMLEEKVHMEEEMPAGLVVPSTGDGRKKDCGTDSEHMSINLSTNQ